jgi:hypothetical protein
MCHPERSEGARLPVRAEELAAVYGFGSFASLRMTSLRTAGVFALGLLVLTACSSPEASRTRGGGPGADVKNWNLPVELHAGAEPYHDTPCVTEPVECNGPPPVFGPNPPPD